MTGMMTGMVAANIKTVLIPQGAALVSEYYDDGGPFAGAMFETLGTNDPNRIDIADLLALTLLDVKVTPPGVRRVLGADAADLSAGLSALPTDLPLWEASDAVLDQADQLFKRLDDVPSIGPVVAGKMLARKRPLLIPIVDKWVLDALKAPKGAYWRSIRQALQDEDLRRQVEACRGSAPLSVSTLRLLDVIIWMQFGESNSARAARRRVGLPLAPRRTA